MRASDKSVTNVEVVVLALARLGGATKKVFSEEIAVEAHGLAPGRFSWRLAQYREQGWPDKYIAKTALEDAKKQEYGRLVEGGYANETAKDGWTLTARGARWVEEHAERVAFKLKLDGPKIPKQDAGRFVKQLKRDPLFKVYGTGKLDSAMPYQFTDMLNCSPDAPRELIKSKFDRLRAISRVAGDPQAVEFLDDCAVKFAGLLAAVKSEENRRGIKP